MKEFAKQSFEEFRRIRVRFQRTILGILLLIVALNCAWSQETPKDPDAATLAKLRTFIRTCSKEGITDTAALLYLRDLSTNIPNENLGTVERFALAEEAK